MSEQNMADSSQHRLKAAQLPVLSFRSVLRQLQVTSFHTKPCVTTYPANDYPLVDVVEAEQLFVAAGGCGASAKSSNEIGRLAAQMVLHGRSATKLPIF